MIDEKKLQQFLGKMIVDLGAAISVPLVRIGMRLGLYKAMDGAGPMTSVEFADEGKHLRTLCPRMARAKRGLGLSDLRTRAADDLSCRQNKRWYSRTKKVHSSWAVDLMLSRLCIRRNR